MLNRSYRALVKHCLNCSTLLLLVVPLVLVLIAESCESVPIDDDVFSSKPGGLSELDEVEDDDEVDEAEEWIDDADEPHVAEPLY